MKTFKSIFICIITFLIILGIREDICAQEMSETDDPEYWSAQGYIDDAFYNEDSIGNGVRSANPGRGEYTLRKGIDVSKWQGDIDWAKAKSAGVEFAIIRVGYRSDSTGRLGEDEKYIQNIEGALANDIRVGVYIFSQAITEEEAIEEANYVLSRIYKYNITLPIVIDYEYRSGENGVEGRLYDADLSKAQATAICRAFCETVEAAGYTGMVYANKSMLTNQLDAEELADDYRIWLAHYTSSTNYAGTYDFWQYSSTGDGYAYGMESQYLDMNWWYDDGKIYGKDYSAVFDAEYYANRYPDVKESCGDDAAKLLSHFITYGMNEGRQGNESFNVHSYKNLYPDLRRAFENDLAKYYRHYIDWGQKEGRVATGYETAVVGATTIYNSVDYAAVYDYSDYIKYNSDVYNAFGTDEVAVLEHFVKAGMNEGRQAKDSFNVYSYKNLYSDLRQAFGNNLSYYYQHYMDYGQKEGRIAKGYETTLVGATTIYNGVDYAVVYDYSDYIKYNPDVYNAFGTDEVSVLEHFVKNGMSEGRIAKDTFEVYSYRGRYGDLQNAFGTNLKDYYIHYIYSGVAEGRIGTPINESYTVTFKNGDNVIATQQVAYGKGADISTIQKSGAVLSLDKSVDCITSDTMVQVEYAYIFDGVDYSTVFDAEYYLNEYADLRAAFGTDGERALEHFVKNGMAECRQGKATFNAGVYRSKYLDLQNAFGDNWEAYYKHYITYGKDEGRSGI